MAETKNRPVPTYDRLQKKQKARMRLPIVMDDDAAQRLEDAQQAVAIARITDRPAEEIARLESEVAEAQAAVDKETVVLTFQAMRRRDYDELVAAWPATEDQIAEHKAEGLDGKPSWNTDEFAPRLVQATCVDAKTGEPKFTLQQVLEFFDDWAPNEVTALYSAAIAVCNSTRMVDLGKGSGQIRR